MQWKILPSFQNYEISEFGDIRRWRGKQTRFVTGACKKQSSANGYKFVRLCRYGFNETVRVNRAVAEAFHGPSPFEGAVVCHNDGCRTNNHYSNLRWDDAFGNQADTLIHGTRPMGDTNGKSILSEADIPDIRRAVASGEMQKSVAARYSVSTGAIWNIISGRCWSHVA